MIARARRRRRTVPRRQTARALREGRCLFAVHDGGCAPELASVGLRDPHDIDVVLCCRRHLPHLRHLRPIEAERLARYLHVVFLRAA